MLTVWQVAFLDFFSMHLQSCVSYMFIHMYLYTHPDPGFFSLRRDHTTYPVLQLAFSLSKHSGHLSIPVHMDRAHSVSAARRSIEWMLLNLFQPSPNGGPLGWFAFSCSEPLALNSSAHLWISVGQSPRSGLAGGRGPAHPCVSRSCQIPSRELYP